MYGSCERKVNELGRDRREVGGSDPGLAVARVQRGL